MELSLPPRIDLARCPTPLQKLERFTNRDLWVKRDDLTGVALSGNKVRKLEHLIADAQAKAADTLITCGGVNSNHARATAVAARATGLSSHLVLRGEDRHPPIGNLLLDRIVGAEITFITNEEWADRAQIMQRVADELADKGRRGYVIPEGGSSPIGCLGYVNAVSELLVQEEELGIRIDRIVAATGTGGTVAGLALGLAAANRDVEVFGVAVCDDRAYFDARINEMLDGTVAGGFVDASVRDRADWQIIEGYKGLGYAKTTDEELKTYIDLARQEGLFLDPVYTGKAFRAAMMEASLSLGTTVFLHTGGIFELFAYAGEIAALTH